MSDLGHGPVPAMPGVSLVCLEMLAETILELLQPSALRSPEPIRLLEWIDRLLPRFGIHVMPAGDEELRDCAAITYPSGEAESEILVREFIWKDLAEDPRPNFSRATVMHEIAHAILHVPLMREGARGGVLPSSPPQAEIPAFSDPEWQAWALAGAILMPRRTLATLSDLSPKTVADTYLVSEQFAAVHLKRLKINA